MKPILQISMVAALALALSAGFATSALAAGRGGGWGGGGNDECAYRVQRWESLWRQAMQREGQGSWNERSARSEMDRARADCCRSGRGRWFWCGDNGRVLPEDRYRNPNDPDRIYLDRNRDGSYRGGNNWSNGLGGSDRGSGDRGGSRDDRNRGRDGSDGWRNNRDGGRDSSHGNHDNRDRGGDDSDRGRRGRDRGGDDQSEW
jgi:hypothetical protein